MLLFPYRAITALCLQWIFVDYLDMLETDAPPGKSIQMLITQHPLVELYYHLASVTGIP